MNVEFKVHGVSNSNANVKTEVEGEVINASAPSLEVELTPVAARGGSLTLRFIGSQIEPAKELFKSDAVIVASFANKESYKEAAKPA